jgi:glutathione synthase/RimK-type ligase-like ATP-grasp enzyme
MINDCCILNTGGGSWAFAPLARQLSSALCIDVTDQPRTHNYLLLADDSVAASLGGLFIPFPSMVLAADKSAQAQAFARASVPTPQTHVLDSLQAALAFASSEPDKEWCLKFPTGVGATGHRLLTPQTTLPDSWPRPLIVQEFIRMPRPEVFRLYAAGGGVFGWVARRFPATTSNASPWVAHARGARYEAAGDPPAKAVAAARAALDATGLFTSFGCADLLRRADGEWLVLEIGTDGMFNHVDRDLGLPALEREMQERVAEAFWQRLGTWRPWGRAGWRPSPAQ